MRGISYSVTVMVAMMIIIGIVVAFYAAMNKAITEFHVIPIEATSRTYGIILANVILSDENLIYVDNLGNRYRGIFDSVKLNSINGGEISYGSPNSLVFIWVRDLKTNKVWIFKSLPKGIDLSKFQNILDCLSRVMIPIRGLMDIEEVYKCIVKGGGKSVYSDEFPVAIKDGDEIHTGKMGLIFRVIA